MDVSEIIRNIASGDRPRMNQAVKQTMRLADGARKEKWAKEKTGAKDDLRVVRDSFIEMCKSSEPELRWAGLRGLCAMQITDEFDEKMGEMAGLFVKLIADDDGKVRLVCANALACLIPPEWRKSRRNPNYSEDDYVKLFLTLQAMHHKEKSPKKTSFNNALNKMWCPYLENLLLERGFQLTESRGRTQ